MSDPLGAPDAAAAHFNVFDINERDLDDLASWPEDEDGAGSPLLGDALTTAWLAHGTGAEFLPQPPQASSEGAPAASPAPPMTPPASPPQQHAPSLSMFRCLDSSHPQPCPFCLPAPPEDEHADYELVGEAGKRNGEKKLRSLLCRTREWNTAEERSRLADVCDARGSPAASRLAVALRTKRSSGLTKGQMLILARAWGYASSLWFRHGRASRRTGAVPGGAAPAPAPAPAAAAHAAAAPAAAPSGGGGGAGGGPAAAAAAACFGAAAGSDWPELARLPAGPPAAHGDGGGGDRLTALRLAGGGYRWAAAASPAPPPGPSQDAAAAAAAAQPETQQQQQPGLRAAAEAEASAVLRPLGAVAARLLRGDAARAAAAFVPSPFFGPADLAEVRRVADFFEREAEKWLALSFDAERAATEAFAATAAASQPAWASSSPPLGADSGAAAAAAATAASDAAMSDGGGGGAGADGGALGAPAPPAAASPPAATVPSALRHLSACVRHLATSNCARAFHRHPAVQEAMRAHRVATFEAVACGEEDLGPGVGDPATDVAPEHAAAVAVWMVEAFRGFAAATELATRLQLLLAEARLGSVADFAAASAVVAAVATAYAADAGAAARARAGWMWAEMLRFGGTPHQPRARLLFKAAAAPPDATA